MADSFRSWILDHRPDERHAGQSRPDLLLLDEPSQGLGPRIVDQIFDTIDRIRSERRLTILLVEQRVVESLELCNSGYVLKTGAWC
jgi:branched-chain amino acid transport system ATP-binding protein